MEHIKTRTRYFSPICFKRKVNFLVRTTMKPEIQWPKSVSHQQFECSQRHPCPLFFLIPRCGINRNHLFPARFGVRDARFF